MAGSFTNYCRYMLLVLISLCLCRADTISAQRSTGSPGGNFNVAGRVVAKSKYGFELQTMDGKNIEITIADDTDFALRMSRPSFKIGNGQVAVDGTKRDDGQPQRIRLDLPKGKLYLLAQFRHANHRKRIMSEIPWRLNHYLISNQPIEAALPRGNEILLSGEVDVETSELKVGEVRYPIRLGFRGATLAGRSIADIKTGHAVVVAGVVAGESKLAKTVLFTFQ